MYVYIFFHDFYFIYIYLYAQIYIYWDLHFKAIKMKQCCLTVYLCPVSLSQHWCLRFIHVESVAVAPSFSLLQSTASSEYATVYLSIQWLTWLVLMVSYQQDCDEFSSTDITVYSSQHPSGMYAWEWNCWVSACNACSLPGASAMCEAACSPTSWAPFDTNCLVLALLVGA